MRRTLIRPRPGVRWEWSLLLLGLLLPSGAPRADPMPMTSGGDPLPHSSTQVALLAEQLRLTVDFDAVEVEARFELHNPGEAVALPVGFPCDPGWQEGAVGLSCKTRLTVRVEGRAVPVKLHQTRPRVGAWVWPMSFPARQSVPLVVTYTTRLRNERYAVPLDGMGLLHYQLRTGAAWAGPIGRLEIDLELPLEGAVYLEPPGYIRTPGRIRWDLRDHEPDRDVLVVFNLMQRFTVRARDGWTARQLIQAGAYDPRPLPRLAQEWPARTAANLEELEGWFRIVTARSELPRTFSREEAHRVIRETGEQLYLLAVRAGALPWDPAPAASPPAASPAPPQGIAPGSEAPAPLEPVACESERDCGWDDPCRPTRCQAATPDHPGCDKSLPPRGSCRCLDHRCTLERTVLGGASPPGCRQDGDCVLDLATASCDLGSALDRPIGPILTEGPSCRCDPESRRCLPLWSGPVACRSWQDCSWIRRPRLRPVPAAAVPRPVKRPVRPCRDGEIDSICRNGRCQVVGWGC